MPARSDDRSHRSRLRALLAGLVGTVVLALAPAASAQGYTGATAQWGKLTATISSGSVRAFATRTGALQTCDGQPRGDSLTDPLDIRYTGAPVPIVGGRFELTGTAPNLYGDQLTFTVDGAVARDGREVSGTVTAGGATRMAGDCTGTWSFDAIIPPSGSTTRPAEHDFGPDPDGGTPSNVSFDYDRGVITHLTAGVGVTCPGGSVFGATVDSAAYGLDPIHVSKSGHFELRGAVLDGYGVINHYVIEGRVSGARASGRVSSSRLYDTGNIDGEDVVTCRASGSWQAVGPSKPVAPARPVTTAPSAPTAPTAPTAPGAPVVTSGPTAYYEVDAYRYGRAGAWNYYLEVTFTGCRDATTVVVAVEGGPHVTAPCRGTVKLGPLTPQRNYRVTVGAVPTGSKGSPVAAPPTAIYLPGDDGVWIRR